MAPTEQASRHARATLGLIADRRCRRDGICAMKVPRRRFLHLAAGVAALPALSRIARAHGYPTRPVHMIVGFPAGLTPDIVARLMGQWLSDRLGQQFIVENRPGASANLATEIVARAAPDGYTLLVASSSNAINATLYETLKFDFVRHTVPIAGIVRTPFILAVRPAFPAKTVADFIAYAKANPGRITLASAGIGTTPHLAGELFKQLVGVEITHVPYRGSYMTDLLSGQVQAAFPFLPTAINYIRSGELRALAVSGATRVDQLPDIPTVGETVPGYEASGWTGLCAPAQMAAEIVDALNGAINAGLADARLRARLADLGGVPMQMTPAEFSKFIADEVTKWAKVIVAAKIKHE
jgi:tripartite-type tricarboxylate transporter receptor subunit TctC